MSYNEFKQTILNMMAGEKGVQQSPMASEARRWVDALYDQTPLRVSQRMAEASARKQ